MPEGTMSYQARMAAAAVGTAVASFTEVVEFETESIAAKGTIIDGNGTKGTRSSSVERTTAGPYSVGGQLVIPLSPTMLDTWLPRILGAVESSDTFALAETLPEFDLLINRGPKRFVYGGCKVNKATFQGKAGSEPIKLILDILGKTETLYDTAFPSLSNPTDPPYGFYQAVCTLVSSARIITEFDIVVDNQLNVRTSNSLTATDINPTGRVVTAKFRTPFTSDETDLYGQSNAGSAGSVAITNGGRSTTFTFGTLQVPNNSPVVGGRGEIMLQIEAIARKTGSTNELVVTNDSTA